ncbi:MAG: metallophosphoesterase [Bacilli bacterium]|nr:metallophosphoesterase [Bacilli bacterium]
MKHKVLIPGLFLLVGLASCGANNNSIEIVPTLFDVNDEIIDYQEPYYHVNSLISGQNFILGHRDGASVNVLGNKNLGYSLTYVRNSSGGSNGQITSYFCINDHYLDVIDEKLAFVDTSAEKKAAEESGKNYRYKCSTLWEYDRSLLSVTKNGVKYYVTLTNGVFSLTEQKDEPIPIQLFTSGEYLSPCIEEQTTINDYVYSDNYVAPTYSVSIKKDLIIDDVVWHIDGIDYDLDSLSFDLSTIDKRECGVYPVYCTIKGRDSEGIYYKEDSYVSNFTVINGVIDDCLLTFSDVHEEYGKIGEAIEEIMSKNEGKIPSLIVCTGDWVNGPTPDDSILRKVYLPQIKGQLSGIDSVYVAANHESYYSVAEESLMADLGADESILDGVGVIYDSRSEGHRLNAKTSINTSGIIVFGINYFSLENIDEDGNKTYSYSHVIEELRAYLEELKDNYNKELILISSHAGLHTLGVDPHSDVSSIFGGNNEYNINLSSDLVELLNEYAEKYGMRFSFQFGHNHSKQETEFLLTPGERIFTTKNYQERMIYNIGVKFSYGHQGYISTSIGSANEHYTVMKWNEEIYEIDFCHLNAETIITRI